MNRKHKELPDGEIIEFEKYPWGNPESIIIDELCPWCQRYYGQKFPFIFKFDGVVQHRLVKYQKKLCNYSGTQLIDITCDFFEDFAISEFLLT